jgi:hypothetical protein
MKAEETLKSMPRRGSRELRQVYRNRYTPVRWVAQCPQWTSFEGLAAFSNRSVDLSDGHGFPERYRCSLMTVNGFSVIGQKPLRGRDFLPDDEQPGVQPIVILSNAQNQIEVSERVTRHIAYWPRPITRHHRLPTTPQIAIVTSDTASPSRHHVR